MEGALEEDKRRLDLDKALSEWVKLENEAYEKGQKLLESIRTMVSPELYEDIKEYLKYCEHTYDYAITTEAPNDNYLQDEGEYETLKQAWVNQYGSGGYTGDEFSGQVWLKINNQEWFTFHYSM